MTEKRYTAIPETVSYKDNLTGERLCPKHEKDYYAVLNKLNELYEENQELKKELALSKPLYSRRKLEKEVEQLKSKNKILLEHCDDLQERNDRQADTIRELYNLIENKDWETLNEHIEEMQRAEEQLLSEMRCYE